MEASNLVSILNAFHMMLSLIGSLFYGMTRVLGPYLIFPAPDLESVIFPTCSVDIVLETVNWMSCPPLIEL